MTLQDELDSVFQELNCTLDPQMRGAMERAEQLLLASGVVDRALKAGERAPDFELRNARGEHVRSVELLTKGPLVLSFFRGGWCPYCSRELRALQRAVPRILSLGASLVAITPEKPDRAARTAARNRLEFPVLTDAHLTLAVAFGLTFELAAELRPYYAGLGAALPDLNAGSGWVLPVPATYVVAPDGVITFGYLDPDYRRRLEPAEIIRVLEALEIRRVATGRPT
jgi:peroxiredoxin